MNNFATLKSEYCNIEKLLQFGRDRGYEWSSIRDAHILSMQKIEELSRLTYSNGLGLLSEDKDFVVFGSLGRKEFTKGSDVDWTLLVDGAVDANNMMSASIIQALLKDNGFKDPGPNGPFGNITFSHDLVHFIGGQDDSNHNLTQRCLLMLESGVISTGTRGTAEGTAYQRVLKATIKQYIENDSGYRDKNPEPHYVPRFLLNDLTRYWRTICVDFANKQIEQDGKKWAIRNFKLRVSRRLIHLKGLLICFECHRQKLTKIDAIDYILSAINECPLNFVYSVLSDPSLEISEESILKLFNSYDKFLFKMNDEQFRKELENLKVSEAYGNEKFIEAREISKSFHSALGEVLFQSEHELQKFLINYGIF